LAVFSLALVVRLLYLYESSASPFFEMPLNDSGMYHGLARALVDGEGLGWRFFYQSAFYPLYLSVVYLIFGPSIIAVKLLQALLGAVTAAMVERFADRIGGVFVGVTAGIVTALYGPLIFFETELLATGWAAFFAVAVPWGIMGALERPKGYRFLSVGLLGGLSTLCRPVFLPFFLVASVWLIVVLRRKGRAVVLKGILGGALGFLLVTMPVAAASWKVTHHFGFLPFSGGVNLYLGNNEDTCDTLRLRPGKRWNEMINAPLEHGLSDPWDKEAYYSDKFFAYVKQHPRGFAGGLVMKVLRFVNGREIPRTFDIYLARDRSSVLGALAFKAGRLGFPFALVFAFAVVGLGFRTALFPVPVRLFLLIYPLSVIAVFVTARYRIPIIPLMAVAAAMGVRHVREVIVSKAPKPLFEAGVILVAALAASIAPPRFCEEDVNLEKEMYFLAGDREAEERRPARAVAMYRKALAIDPDYFEAHEMLGIVLSRMGRVEESVAAFKGALRLEPHALLSLKYIGRSLVALQRYEAAEAFLNRALEVAPDDGEAHTFLGVCLANQGRLTDALEHLERAVALMPKNGIARQNLEKVRERLSVDSTP
jgi:Tfp pilus assembly protein PilF